MNPIQKIILEEMAEEVPDPMSLEEQAAARAAKRIIAHVEQKIAELREKKGMTQIKAGDWTYTITEEDYLWVGRAASGEGDAPAVIWAWLQRFAMLNTPTPHATYNTLTKMVRAHSQPVNPIWQRDGSKCRPGGPYHGTEHCSESRLRRREAMASLDPAAFPAAVKSAMAALRAGTLPNPVPRAVDFAVESVSEAAARRNPSQIITYRLPSGATFLTWTESRAWPSDDYVQLVPGGASHELLYYFTPFGKILGENL